MTMENVLGLLVTFLEEGIKYFRAQNAGVNAPAETTAKGRGRKAKEEKPAEAPQTQAPAPAAQPPAQTTDPLAPQAAAQTATAPAAQPAEMSEADSKKLADDTARDYIHKFKTDPEGITAARKILADRYKVGRLADLTHPQRVDFIAHMKGIIAAFPAPARV